MAMAGSAIGLGNIWRFPYMVGQNGGAAFLIVYLLFSLILCKPIFICECIIGRSSQMGTFGAFKKLAPGTAWQWMSLLTVLTPLIILSYYSVVGGWSIDYLFKSVTFSFSNPGLTQEEHNLMFSSYITSWLPLVSHTIFLALTAFVVLSGIKNGIEKFTKLTTPLLFVLIVVIMIYSLSLPGAKEGVSYLLKPDFSKLGPSSILSALGQAFFSLSIGVGAILTYSSYMSRKESLERVAQATIASDLLFALISGFAIMPAVFAVGLSPDSGPALIFETLPFIFSSMAAEAPVISAVVAILFFIIILCAALTSSISMLEVGVSYLVENKGMGRKKATFLLSTACWAVGALCALSFGPLSGVELFNNSIFDFCDKLTSNFLLFFGSLLFVIFVGWKMEKKMVMDELFSYGYRNTHIRYKKYLYNFIRYIAPIVIVIIFLTSF